MRTRAGYSLVECLVAMGLITAALGSVAVTISGMQRAIQNVGEEMALERELERLALQFRSDAHEAASAGLDSAEAGREATRLTLALGNERTVEYAILSGMIERTSRHGDRSQHRETYRLDRSSSAHWQVDLGGSAAMIALIVGPPPADRPGPTGGRSARVEAAVGLLVPRAESSPEGGGA